MNQQKLKHPVFNNEYEIISSLGEGNTSKVYMVRSIADPKKMVALKLLKEEFLQREPDSIKAVETEIQILQGLKHDNIVNILGWGSDGHVVKPSGREIKNLVYIFMEYVSGGLLFDVCQTLGGMGEQGGRYFMHQMVDVMSHMHGKGVVHRDLKLENILVDDTMNLKVADFGFATFRKIHTLKSYRGTKTYMAPEIKEQKVYDGQQIDIFSTAVILFIIVQGIFPFQEARTDDYYYGLLLKGDLDTYWKKTGSQGLSAEFKDLILKMFSYNGKDRPTLQDIKNHPWMQVPISMDKQRSQILDQVQEARSAATADTSREDVNSRGDDCLDLVRQSSIFELKKFNDMTDYDIDVSPGVIWDDIQRFNTEFKESKLTLEKIDNKCIKITQKAPQGDESDDLVVKVKFFAMGEQTAEDEEDGVQPKIRVRFMKKHGNIQYWYSMMKDMKDAVMSDVLLAPQSADDVEEQE